MILMLALSAQIASQDAFSLRAELQGYYDEISEMTLSVESASDIDALHEVLYTTDSVFIDDKKVSHAWPQVGEGMIQSLAADAPLDWMSQSIDQVSVTPSGATVVVTSTTVRSIVDDAGRYGQKGATHSVSETTVFRDTWVRSGAWKLASREQIGRPAVSVDGGRAGHLT